MNNGLLCGMAFDNEVLKVDYQPTNQPTTNLFIYKIICELTLISWIKLLII